MTINIDAAAGLATGQQHRRPFQQVIPERRLMTEGLYYCVYVDDILILTVLGEPAHEMQAFLALFET